jgi:NAD(P)-dependent dehydrogenase (short-subunit alcohol dehydrogenase family)
VPFAGDVSVLDSCRAAVAASVERFGAIDVMCAHTGIADPLPLLDLTDEHRHRHVAVNVDGVMFYTVEAARAMVAAGRPGLIVCTASINAWFVEETHAVCNVTKAAVWTFIRSAAMHLARRGVRVNGVAPGVADTPLAELVVHDEQFAAVPEDDPARALRAAGGPRGLRAVPGSDEAAYVTGRTIVIDGGQTLGIRGDLEQAAKDRRYRKGRT